MYPNLGSNNIAPATTASVFFTSTVGSNFAADTTTTTTTTYSHESSSTPSSMDDIPNLNELRCTNSMIDGGGGGGGHHGWNNSAGMMSSATSSTTFANGKTSRVGGERDEKCVCISDHRRPRMIDYPLSITTASPMIYGAVAWLLFVHAHGGGGGDL